MQLATLQLSFADESGENVIGIAAELKPGESQEVMKSIQEESTFPISPEGYRIVQRLQSLTIVKHPSKDIQNFGQK